MRLNVGCGDDYREGYVNVDLRAEVADVPGPADDLSFVDDGQADEVMALDLLEHFWRDDVDAVLAEWRRVLKVGGVLTLRVPNLLQLAAQLCDLDRPQAGHGAWPTSPAEDEEVVANTVENIYGGHRFGPGGSWDAHHWGYTPMSLARLLERNGFAVLNNDRRHNMTVQARKL